MSNATTGKPTSVLVTDDESNIRLMVRAALETEGYAVTEAADGRAAVDAVRRDRPDVMILDLNMPVLDGMAVLEQMKSVVGRRPRIVVLTAYGSIPTAVRATRLGAADFLEKPVLPDALRRCVRGVLDEPDPEPAVARRAEPPGGYDEALDRARKALRLMDLPDAEQMLVRAAERRDQQSAAYFNLLGILYESQHKWRLARKCYDRAVDADEHYEPAKTNFRRLDEMRRTGRTERRVVLGDEPDDVWYAQVPAHA
jgi:DNA-binding response OmpR family regulator